MAKKLLFHPLAFTVLVALCGACSGAAIPQVAETDLAAARAHALLERSVAAHGGDVFAELQDLSVAYEGRWGRVVPLLQSQLADKRYRRSSEERYLLTGGILAQFHTGPAGRKSVLRRPDGVEVRYDGQPVESDQDRLATSALVADAYLLMITAPSWFQRPGVECFALTPVVEEGRTYERVSARFRPGFGFSEQDRALLWIDQETFLVHRVQFSIDGFRRTQGAEVEVTFSEHQEIAGRIWPMRFVERVERPVSAFAHRWRLVGLDVDRGLTAADLDPEAPSAKALAPAGSPLAASAATP
jgi:hypothetical protein